ncbi:hypothetical protein GCM10017557_67190 [Streptomyces aurantiacus]|uniref:Uncharacterized protein n=1 Tax=Streptomyces aurantiacus TaxID=47760 RepID=A0A7G1PDY8_9ACTN|nr:hypothetical protein GCM10017557_67190 [Streptomyces aurantiacus]
MGPGHGHGPRETRGSGVRAPISTTPGELLTLCNDRPDTPVPGPQVEAPISHPTILRDGGSPGQAATIVPYGRWSRWICAPRLTAAVLR